MFCLANEKANGWMDGWMTLQRDVWTEQTQIDV
jgi:hypothetical protein